VVHQKYLRQKDAVVELKSRRSVMPHVRVETEAQLDAAQARLTQARYDLENTKIQCPFDARVEMVGAYKSQVVTAFFSIATLTDMEAFEISVGIDPRELRWLDETIRPSALGGPETADGPNVEVRWSLHGQEFVWNGRVTRFERVDEATRTARMVVEVRQADMVATVRGSDDDASKFTLAIGMYCTTSLPVQPLLDALLVPRVAIHDSRWVYVFEPDESTADGMIGRLTRRAVPMLRTLGDHVLVDYRGRSGDEVCELLPGERVVVSALTGPVNGMKVRLRPERIASADILRSDSSVMESDRPGVTGRETLVLGSAVRAQRGDP
jgi:multidrug efflux pump subunit AcrA (membrane-fusion protein)